MSEQQEVSVGTPLCLYVYGDNKRRATVLLQVNRPIEEVAQLAPALRRTEGIRQDLVCLYRAQMPEETLIELRFAALDHTMPPCFGRIARLLADGLGVEYASTYLFRTLFDNTPMSLPRFAERFMPDDYVELMLDADQEVSELETAFAGPSFGDDIGD